jgi:RNA polymerase subunit RPABC4/transcription elongation factor Spt4
MSELLTAPEWSGMLLIASERNAAIPHRLGRRRNAPQSMGMECRNPSLRPNEMSELFTAPEWSGMLLIASEGNGAIPHRLGRRWDSPRASE